MLWKRAVTTGQGDQKLVFIPVNSVQVFTGGNWQGIRYLVVYKRLGQAINGNLIEILLRRTTAPIDTVNLLSELYNSRGNHMAVSGQTESYAFLYSADYQYLSGKHFRDGKLLAENPRLKFFPTGAFNNSKSGSAAQKRADGLITTPTEPGFAAQCAVWYCLETGQYITTTGDCGGTAPAVPNPEMPGSGGGTTGPGDYGGGGGGGGGDGGGNTSFPTGVATKSAYLEQQTPTLGNYSAQLTIITTGYNLINVLVELDTRTHEIQKISVTLNGIVWYVKISQVGDGTLLNYNPSTDTYTFQVTYQKILADFWSSQVTMTGTISPSHGIGTLTIP